MKALCFTVDLDRDSNIQMPGQTQAGSLDRGAGTEPRFSSSEHGLEILSGLLDEIGVKATFFAEGRTLETIKNAEHLSGHEVGIHGYDHEDFTTISDENERAAILKRSIAAVKDVTGQVPRCFRAPFMRTDEKMRSILPGFGIRYDSSDYADVCGAMIPATENDLCMIPVPKGIDKNGKKITAYLWPMHEMSREPRDFIELSSSLNEGIFVIATHSWHIVESRSAGTMSSQRIEENTENVRKVIESIIDSGFCPLTIPDAVNKVR
jgi:Predicted xylanase/chitin deacetylase